MSATVCQSLQKIRAIRLILRRDHLLVRGKVKVFDLVFGCYQKWKKQARRVVYSTREMTKESLLFPLTLHICSVRVLYTQFDENGLLDRHFFLVEHVHRMIFTFFFTCRPISRIHQFLQSAACRRRNFIITTLFIYLFRYLLDEWLSKKKTCNT